MLRQWGPIDRRLWVVGSYTPVRKPGGDQFTGLPMGQVCIREASLVIAVRSVLV